MLRANRPTPSPDRGPVRTHRHQRQPLRLRRLHDDPPRRARRRPVRRPRLGKIYRSSNRGQQFSFALLDDHGTLRGRLGGLHLREDSPFTRFDFTVVADPHRARAFHLNRYGLYAWSADGELRARMPTADKPFKPSSTSPCWSAPPPANSSSPTASNTCCCASRPRTSTASPRRSRPP
ncbi:hypothetical protein ACF9IK_01485 [Kitasatospora hibisci]|uniref:hypothetical protein n=1 Tax=Kitasatospora hibisci TaxID=3369522 RepID=UPI003754630E